MDKLDGALFIGQAGGLHKLASLPSGDLTYPLLNGVLRLALQSSPAAGLLPKNPPEAALSLCRQQSATLGRGKKPAQSNFLSVRRQEKIARNLRIDATFFQPYANPIWVKNPIAHLAGRCNF